ncbi:hypothetical protein DPMN_108516 [Dreissena polymorpha]|uniref:C1q domain-containing protein n=1 Tax=Dreissena polymorpha TaxID=45954 RepID=A0A9D4QL96_DREPO|nr:hypothetical protein DPMN_108516 [Dreissena polymorpha]
MKVSDLEHCRDRISFLEDEIVRQSEQFKTMCTKQSEPKNLQQKTLFSFVSETEVATEHESNTTGKQHNRTKALSDSIILNELTKLYETKSKRNKRSIAGEIAFSAYLSNPIPRLAEGHVIKCDKTILNDGGAYNVYTGIFNASVDGVYMFSFSINSYTETHVKLVVDGANTADVVSDPYQTRITYEIMASNTILVRLSKGQSVWMEEYKNADWMLASYDDVRFVTFAGLLVY